MARGDMKRRFLYFKVHMYEDGGQTRIYVYLPRRVDFAPIGKGLPFDTIQDVVLWGNKLATLRGRWRAKGKREHEINGLSAQTYLSNYSEA